MDQGVIRSLKAHYKTKAVHKYLTHIELGKPLPDISVLDAMNLFVQAWDYVSNETIINCFKKFTGASRKRVAPPNTKHRSGASVIAYV